MKKILFLLVLIYSYVFSYTTSEMLTYLSNYQCTTTATSATYKNGPKCSGSSSYGDFGGAGETGAIYHSRYSTDHWYKDDGTPVEFCVETNTRVGFSNCSPINAPKNPCDGNSTKLISNILFSCTADSLAPIPNPDPLGGGQCRDLFQKDGVAYTCNPNSNEATPIPNSNGTILDPETGADKPNCNDGYDSYTVPNITAQGPNGTTQQGYTSWGCAVSSPTGGDTGNTSGTGGTSEPTVTTNPDGSKTWVSPDGNTYNLTTNGTLTTTYADGSTSVKQVGGDYSAGSSGGSGTSGGGTGGTSGNTTNEDNTTPPTDTPIDNTPVANSCTDSALTLQERMLCELNAGMKKQNSEGAPENSLNQLLKDLKTSNQTDNTAINTNLKDVKALQENQLNKQTQANATLEKINDSANGTELYNKVMTEDLNKLVNNTQDEEGKSYLGTITDFVKTLTTPVSGDDKSSYSNQINSNVNSSLGSTLSKYSNVLGFGSTYANRPENITMTIFNQQYTLIDFSILDPYVSIIRSLFLTLAFLYGFMNLIRSSN